METYRAICQGLVVVLLAVAGGALADSKIGSETAGFDTQANNTDSAKGQVGGSKIVATSNEVREENKGKVSQLSKSNGGVADDANKDNSSGQTGSKETSNKERDNKEINNKQKGGSSGGLQVEEDNQNGERTSGDSSKLTDVQKEKSNGVSSEVPVAKSKKEGPPAEECDPSNKCTDKENKLVACLRVPGNESPDLSLLVQNKGKTPLGVTIGAPDFVQLEKTKFQLQEKENRKVKVSITKGGQENFIVLTAENSRCELDIRDLISHNFGHEFDISHKSIHVSFMTRTRFTAFLCFAALMTLASGWVCFSFRRKQLSENGTKYQKHEMELPISSGSRRAEFEVNDGWDKSWEG